MQVQQEAELLYRHYDRTSRLSEYPSLMSDLAELARQAADKEDAGELARTLQRMLLTFRAFQR